MPKKKDFILKEKYFDVRRMRKLCEQNGIDPYKYYPKHGTTNDNRVATPKSKRANKRNS